MAVDAAEAKSTAGGPAGERANRHARRPVAIIAVLAVVAVHNAFAYPSIGGYDAQEYITYARDIVDHGALPPNGVGAYYTPPGYMAVAGLAGSLGRALDMHDPDHLGQLVNALAVIVSGRPRPASGTDALAVEARRLGRGGRLLRVLPRRR